jgi:DNA-binding CsgD family transcriptional regulator
MDIRPVSASAVTPPVTRAFERVLAQMEGPGFEAAVDATLGELVQSKRFYMFDGGERSPVTLRMARYEEEIAHLVDDYMRRYLPHDPVSDALPLLSSADSLLLRVTPEDIKQGGYRDRFFYDCDIVERVSLLQRTDAGWRCLNISRGSATGACSDEELSRFVAIGQLLLPMVARHCGRIAVATPTRSSVPEVERRFAERRPELSNRERQVCARAAIGMSVEATALDLGIALTSVLTYRKRAYGRLSVSSPYELACLVMN